MDVRFSTPARRWIFLSAIILAAAAYIVSSVKIVVADYYAAKQTQEGLTRAADLEPSNPRLQYLLAHYWHYSLPQEDLRLAIAYYHRALTLDPRSAKTWLDVAAAYEEAGSLAQAREAYVSALQAYPDSADGAWRYGNFLLRQGEFAEAFPNIRRAVQADPTLAPAAIATCWRADPDIQAILDGALPPVRSVYLSSLRYLVDARADDAALAVWKRLIETKLQMDLSESSSLIDELARQDRIADAKRVWQDAIDKSGMSQPSASLASVLWDGGFEQPLTGGGFGWRKTEVPGARFDFDREIKHSGDRSLRITFDGQENLDFNHLIQFVPVEPLMTYEFSAYLRTEGITTNRGPRFYVFEWGNPAILQMTPQLTGTQPWTRLELSLTTGSSTHLIAVALRRAPSEKFDNKLAGTVWIDDVALKMVPRQQRRSAP